MTLQEKLNLVTNYFAEDWAIEKAMQLLEDYDKAQQPVGRVPLTQAKVVEEACMALSDQKIAEIGETCGLGCKVTDAGYSCDMLWFDGNPTPFARAIEAEVRKQDDALADSVLEDAARLLESQHTWLTNVAAANLVRSLAARKQGTSHD